MNSKNSMIDKIHCKRSFLIISVKIPQAYVSSGVRKNAARKKAPGKKAPENSDPRNPPRKYAPKENCPPENCPRENAPRKIALLVFCCCWHYLAVVHF